MFLVFFKSIIFYLPTSKSLSYFWNFGSLLGLFLVIQIVSGLFLAIYYSNDGFGSFDSVQYLMFEVNLGWFVRLLHFNGASFFFFLLYIHISKGLFFFSYRLVYVWFFGLLMFLVFMAEAFLGYVLVWAQMSFWAAVVITNLLSVFPFFGSILVCWIWGGFTVVSLTLKFFFVIHFLIPFFSFFLIFFHLYFLHFTGSTSFYLFVSDYNKISFFPYYWIKDFLGFLFVFSFFLWSMFFSFFLGDSEMFIECDSLKSPVHIVPEWYYLIFYAILRSIYSKSLGVFLLFFSILFFFVFCFFVNYNSLLDVNNSFLVFCFLFSCIILGWLGQCYLEYPFLDLGFFFSFIYFFLCFFLFFNYLLTFFLF